MTTLGRCPVCNREVPVVDRGVAIPHNTPGTAYQCSGSGRVIVNVPRAPKKGPDEFLTVAEVAEKLRVSKMTVYRLCHANELKSKRIGQSMRIRSTDLAAFLGDE